MRHFEQQLQELLQKIVLMASMVESMIAAAVRCLVERNESYAKEVYEKEREVDRLQIDVDDMAVKLTALQQPMAADVRFLFMASRIASELERIGDQAINIVQNAKHILGQPPLKPLVDLPIMAEFAQKMVRDSLTALVERDVDLAEQVLEVEQKVDAFRDQVFRELLTYMMADPGTIQRALPLILISRNLERVGDHATNIAEEVIYLVQGKDVRHGAGAK
ncbi:MAG: phosphate signaling complex protein PhoU [Planctomycetota bacterium]|nr:phosphate signaling complex protein PhoU [Planctomycetota bacterium]